MKNSRQLLLKITSVAIFVTFVVVVLGAFTRLVDAGLGCPDWPTCYGHFWVPNTDAEINEANEKFIGTPVETDKTWPEQIHRLFASGLGVIILIMSVLSLISKDKGLPKKLPLIILVVVIVQGLFGMWTVTLKLWPQVVTLHLLGGFSVLSLLWLLGQRLAQLSWVFPTNHLTLDSLLKTRKAALVCLLVLIIQIALGGWVSSNYAALACSDLPTCHGQYLPDMNFSEGFNVTQAIGPNYLGGLLESEARTAIHFSHRVGAIVVTLSLIYLAFLLWQLSTIQTRRSSLILLSALIVQVVLGLSNIIWSLPLPTAVMHNAGGALLLLILVTINHRLVQASYCYSRSNSVLSQGACYG